MTAQTTRFQGQPVSAAPVDGPMSFDKWALVDDLRLAAPDLGLSHRSVAVLRAMLTFLPDRTLTALPGRAIVFASNATLAARLGGMPESTLRRHLAALVASGVVSRCDSPNRKRYARRLGSGLGCAFGFDMGPLAIMARDIGTLARAAERRAEEHAVLRSAALVARQDLFQAMSAQGIDPDGPNPQSPLIGRARLMLRRKDNVDDLRQLIEDLENARKTLVVTTETGGSDTGNERHQHKGIHKDSETPAPVDNARTPKMPDQLMPFRQYHLMFPDMARNWHEVTAHARQLVPMMGIDMQVYDEASAAMGPRLAPLAIFCLLERFETLRNPGGYLRRLTQTARLGQLDYARLLRATEVARPELSADNFSDGRMHRPSGTRPPTEIVS